MRSISRLAAAVALMIVFGSTGIVRAQPPVPPDEAGPEERTPPRLSYVDGQVSFWRPGAPEWVAAQVNTALAPGDELSTGAPGNVEIQIGTRAFVRAWAGTGVGLVNQEPDFFQFKVTAGHASLDLRTLDPGRTVEIDTPNAAFTIDHPGYYRVQVQGDRTAFISRRGGRAIVTSANGQAVSIAASEEVIVEGMEAPRVASYAAPPLDEWDRWNYARTDYVGEAVSARYVSPGVYGVSDLDRYGRWRVVPEYGSVWVPTAVATGWVPYSTGSWTWDPYYGWTWVDTAPWGWAPFHYGRWVFVDSYWAWAPGPVVVRPAYAPALVAFFGGGPSVSARVGWCALGWGEPVIRWWGAPRFVGAAWWGGWGGPRVVNNVVISRATVVNVHNINVYRNVGIGGALVAVDHQRFGRGPVTSARLHQVDTRNLEVVRGRLDIAPVAGSLVPTTVRGVRPSDDRHARPVVATRPPQGGGGSAVIEPGPRPGGGNIAPAPRIVPAPRTPNAAVESPRAPFGQGHSERPQPPPPPRFGRPLDGNTPSRREPVTPPSREPRAVGPTMATPPVPPAPRTGAPQLQAPQVEARPQAPAPRQQVTPRVEGQRPQPTGRLEAPRPQARPLPGDAADRMSPGRGEGKSSGGSGGSGERR
jgi:hypothetical protein